MSATYPEAEYLAQCSPYVLEVRALWLKWFHALEARDREGVPVPFLPDPFGVKVSAELAAKIFEMLIAHGWEKQPWLKSCSESRGGPYDAGPGWERMSPGEQVALIQEWSAIKHKHETLQAQMSPAQRESEEAARMREQFMAAMNHGYL